MVSMIEVVIKKNSSGCFRGFEVKGHAGYDDYGRDIVCAAASVTAYTTAGALEDIAGIKGCYSEKSGLFVINLPDEERMTAEQRNTADIILKTAEIGFRQIEYSYPEFLSVTEKEV